MILHIVVADAELIAHLNGAAIVKLRVVSNESREVTIAAAVGALNIAKFNQTIHFPIEMSTITDSSSFIEGFNDEIIRLDFYLITVSEDGKSSPLGVASLLTNPFEHVNTKRIEINAMDGSKTGAVTITTLYYKTPIDLTGSGFLQINQDQELHIPNNREYSFLLSRRMNSLSRGRPSQSSSYNAATEKLLDVEIAMNGAESNVFQNTSNRRPSSSNNTINTSNKANKTINNSSHSKFKDSSSSRNTSKTATTATTIASRKTTMSVGYVGVAWPDADSERIRREKALFKLHLAEKRRLEIMREVAGEVHIKRLNKQASSDAMRKHSVHQSIEDQKLLSLLAKRDREIETLRKRLELEKAYNLQLVRQAPGGRSLLLNSPHFPSPKQSETSWSMNSMHPKSPVRSSNSEPRSPSPYHRYDRSTSICLNKSANSKANVATMKSSREAADIDLKPNSNKKKNTKKKNKNKKVLSKRTCKPAAIPSYAAPIGAVRNSSSLQIDSRTVVQAASKTASKRPSHPAAVKRVERSIHSSHKCQASNMCEVDKRKSVVKEALLEEPVPVVSQRNQGGRKHWNQTRLASRRKQPAESTATTTTTSSAMTMPSRKKVLPGPGKKVKENSLSAALSSSILHHEIKAGLGSIHDQMDSWTGKLDKYRQTLSSVDHSSDGDDDRGGSSRGDRDWLSAARESVQNFASVLEERINQSRVRSIAHPNSHTVHLDVSGDNSSDISTSSPQSRANDLEDNDLLKTNIVLDQYCRDIENPTTNSYQTINTITGSHNNSEIVGGNLIYSAYDSSSSDEEDADNLLQVNQLSQRTPHSQLQLPEVVDLAHTLHTLQVNQLEEEDDDDDDDMFVPSYEMPSPLNHSIDSLSFNQLQPQPLLQPIQATQYEEKKNPGQLELTISGSQAFNSDDDDDDDDDSKDDGGESNSDDSFDALVDEICSGISLSSPSDKEMVREKDNLDKPQMQSSPMQQPLEPPRKATLTQQAPLSPSPSPSLNVTKSLTQLNALLARLDKASLINSEKLFTAPRRGQISDDTKNAQEEDFVSISSSGESSTFAEAFDKETMLRSAMAKIDWDSDVNDNGNDQDEDSFQLNNPAADLVHQECSFAEDSIVSI